MEVKEKYSLELLMDYVDGLVDQSTHDRISRLIETDQEVATLVQGILGYYEAKGTDREGLEEYLKQTPPMPFRKETPVRRMNSWLSVAVAAMLIGAVAIWFTLGSSPDRMELAIEYSSEVYQPQTQVRGDAEAAFAALETQYNAGEYQTVIDELSTVTDKSVMQELFFGLSLFNTGAFEVSTASLEKVANSESRYAEHALWYLALASIHASAPDAEDILSRIIESNGYKADQAKELLSADSSSH
jgi:hypothetical protein